MADLHANLDAVDVMRYATMTVILHRTKEMRIRVWCAVMTLRLAAWILNCDIEFKRG